VVGSATAQGAVLTVNGAPVGNFLVAGHRGGGGSTDGIARSADRVCGAAFFNQPDGVAVDAAGNIYVVDTSNDTIRKITAARKVSTVAESPSTTGSTDATGGAALFNSLRGLATDAAGNVYIADTFNDVIRKITLSGPVSTLAGTAGLPDPAAGTGHAAHFIHPHGLATDSTGNVYVADTLNHTTHMITPAGAR
jgi:sugar lactone lactonase YvrE